jgi:hypothetical protein
LSYLKRIQNLRTSQFVVGLIILGVSLSSISFYVKDNNIIRAIQMDGYGYYGYLPFVFEMKGESFDGYLQYTGDEGPDPFYVRGKADKRVNKYYAGEALLISPFYLASKLLDKTPEEKAAGYHRVNIFSVVFAALFYFAIGLLAFRSILSNLQFKDWVVSICMILVTIGTNLYWYAVEEPSMSHVYSFGLINLFILLAQRIQKSWSLVLIGLAYLTLGLIVLVRPTNILVVLFIPFFMDWKNIGRVFLLFRFWPIFLLIVFIQPLLYYVQCGHWWVWGYADEFFDFSDPHILDTLISWKKGLFVFFPVLLLTIPGLFAMYWQNWKLTTRLFIPLVVLFYILSSWHAWHYGWNFGVRGYVEFYLFLMIPVAVLLQNISNSTWKMASVIVFISYSLMHSRSATRMARIDYAFIQEITSEDWKKLLFKTRQEMKIEIENIKKNENN